jgi:hypothetical protein
LHGYDHLREPVPNLPTTVRPFLAVNGHSTLSEKGSSALHAAETAGKGVDSTDQAKILVSGTTTAAAATATRSKPAAPRAAGSPISSEDEGDIVLDAERVAEVVEAAKQQQENKQQGTGSSNGKASAPPGAQDTLDEPQDAESLAVSSKGANITCNPYMVDAADLGCLAIPLCKSSS